MNCHLSQFLPRTICCAVGCIALMGQGNVFADKSTDFFETRIRPVLVEHCYQCHSADARNIRGGLLLDSRNGWESGGDSGPAVVPGNPEDSLLMSALRHDSFEMPPDKRLPAETIRHFEQWIRDGAIDPRQGKAPVRESMDLVEGRRFWSFQPVAEVEPPAVSSDWAKTPIDAFIAAHHQQHQVVPVADATAGQVLRRLYFALTGLPPLPDDLRRFEESWSRNQDTAVEQIIDELLDSPRFGERWGRHWLDVTRFAESSGGGRSLMFPHAWRFRDYVIQSFNDDKPFDELIREHLAGDLLTADSDAKKNEQLTGAGYLALGPNNYELQDKELLRMEVVDEQIDTVGRTFLGLTLGCARCHDHKFDPIPTQEYYALAGIFRSTQSLVPGNVSGYVTATLNSPSHDVAMNNWKARKSHLVNELKQLQHETGSLDIPKKGGINAETLAGYVIDNMSAIFEGSWTKSTTLAPHVGSDYRFISAGTPGSSVRYELSLPESGTWEVRLSHNYQQGRCTHLVARVTHADGTTAVTIDQSKAPPDRVFSSLGEFAFDSERPAVITLDASQSRNGVVIADAVQFVRLTDRADRPDAEQKKALLVQLTEVRKELEAHTKNMPEAPVAMSVCDEAEPSDWHVHIRGNIRNLGPVTPRGFLSIASRKIDESGRAVPVEIPDGTSGRLQLAEWIASPNNPLTTRVYVNRVWQHLIGEGLVRTPDNFGQTGTAPTHPELLDYLAATFVTQDQWSTKSLIRRVAKSRIFRLSSGRTDDDPENTLLTRSFRRQLDAEALRDSILQISGQLDLTFSGGRTISKLSTYDGNYDHNTDQPNTRSVYVPFFRNAILESLEVFDTANPNVVTGRRVLTVLPGQALYLMNSPFVQSQAQHAAARLINAQAEATTDHKAMIEQATLMTLGRLPTDAEFQTLSEVLDSSLQKEESWSMIFRALFGSIDFRFVD